MSMFEVPASKRIRREDIRSASRSTASRSPSPGIAKALHSQLALHFPHANDCERGPGSLFPCFQAPPLEHKQDDHERSEPKEAHPFRLFTSQAPSRAPHIRVLSPELGPGGFVRPRSPRHFFTGPPSAELVSRYASSAVSGAHIRAQAKCKCPGLAVPWRVTRLVMGRRAAGKLVRTPPVLPQPQPVISPAITMLGDQAQHSPLLSDQLSNSTQGRPKPGRKRRIVLRQRSRVAARAAEEAAAAAARAAQDAEEKAAAERIKRAQRNREKKVKRTAREKAKKTAALAEAEAEAAAAAAAAGGEENG